jgi:hypothetical protein
MAGRFGRMRRSRHGSGRSGRRSLVLVRQEVEKKERREERKQKTATCPIVTFPALIDKLNAFCFHPSYILSFVFAISANFDRAT